MQVHTEISARRIVLASQSPRRKELLTQAGLSFDVIPSREEEQMTAQTPWEIVQELAMQKAENVYEQLTDGRQDSQTPLLVIGADTVVAYQTSILGKPRSSDEAAAMLECLQGNTHQVYTGVALVWNAADGQHRDRFYEQTEVTFYPMSRQEILDYVATGDCMDKAGAYGIQTRFGIHVKSIAGDYNNVVGLPIARLYQECKRLGLWNAYSPSAERPNIV